MSEQNLESEIEESLILWRKHPDVFVQDVLGVELEPYQTEILQALPDNKFIAVKSGHGSGKTALESWIICWFLMCYPECRVPITAPTEKQLTQVLWPEISKWLTRRPELKEILEWTKSKVFVRGEEQSAFAVYRTASKPEALQGFHEGNILFILEEASGIEDPIWEPVEGALTSGNARAIALGNPTRPEGNFYRAFTDQSKFWKTFTINVENSGRVSKEYIERMASKYGRDSDVYRVRVLGEFPSQISDAFIPLWVCERSLDLEIPHHPVLRMGVDVARYGDDYTVWLIRGGGKIIHVERQQTMDTMQIAGRIIQLKHQFNIAADHIFLDVIGVGAGVVDRLHELGHAVVDVNNAEKAKDEENYLNVRAETWGVVKQELIEKKLNLSIGNDPELTKDLCGELASPKYKITSKGQYQLEAKEDMKKRGIGSPDLADALTLTYYYPDFQQRANVRSGRGMVYPKNY